MPQFDPDVVTVKLKDLRPTQMTVGVQEIKKKQQQWQGKNTAEVKKIAVDTFFPGVIGSGQHIYLTDHHHTARALHGLVDCSVKVAIQDDLSMLSEADFWIFMDHRTWVHCYDVSGMRQPFKAMPNRLDQMADDPYRSLATEVRRAGGFAKSDLPYLEFLWANYFRHSISKKLVVDDLARAVKQATKLARDKKANFLPGWAGKP